MKLPQKRNKPDYVLEKVEENLGIESKNDAGGVKYL